MRLCVFKINHLQWMILPNYQDGPFLEFLGGWGMKRKLEIKFHRNLFAYGSPY